MKRPLFQLFLFLLLGAILNVAVAWWAAAIPTLNSVPPTRDPTPEEKEFWLSHRPDGFTQDIGSTFDIRRFGYDAHGFGGDYIRFHSAGNGITFHNITGDKQFVLELACTFDAGWPCRALVGTEWVRHDATSTSQQTVLQHVFKWEGWLAHAGGTALPFQPIWPGFAINTIFYAAILWLPFAALGAFRRRRRIKRGLCPKCAYDLRGSQKDLCPECGTALLPADSRKPTAESPQ